LIGLPHEGVENLVELGAQQLWKVVAGADNAVFTPGCRREPVCHSSEGWGSRTTERTRRRSCRTPLRRPDDDQVLRGSAADVAFSGDGSTVAWTDESTSQVRLFTEAVGQDAPASVSVPGFPVTLASARPKSVSAGSSLASKKYTDSGRGPPAQPARTRSAAAPMRRVKLRNVTREAYTTDLTRGSLSAAVRSL